MLLLYYYYYYILIMILLYSYYDIMLLFLKKSNQKTRSICNALVCENISPHYILPCANHISLTHLFVSFDHTQSPLNLYLILFFFYIVLFFGFFQSPSMFVPSYTFNPLYFSFFCFSNASSFSFSSREIHHMTILLQVSHI